MLVYAMADYETTTKLDSRQLLDQALEMDGTTAACYTNFYNYSLNNQIALYMQGVREIVGTRSQWRGAGREVVKGSESYYIYKPVMVQVPKEGGEDGETVEVFTGRFIKIWPIYTLSQTEGEPVKPPVVPGWSFQQAAAKFGVQVVPFATMNGNLQGYTQGNRIAISPIAANPPKTAAHELMHYLLGHTRPPKAAEYLTHRGRMEAQAEAGAYIILNMLGVMDEKSAQESRGYVRWWLRSEQEPLTEQECREVISAADRILRAGRVLGQLAVKATVETDTDTQG